MCIWHVGHLAGRQLEMEDGCEHNAMALSGLQMLTRPCSAEAWFPPCPASFPWWNSRPDPMASSGFEWTQAQNPTTAEQRNPHMLHLSVMEGMFPGSLSCPLLAVTAASLTPETGCSWMGTWHCAIMYMDIRTATAFTAFFSAWESLQEDWKFADVCRVLPALDRYHPIKKKTIKDVGNKHAFFLETFSFPSVRILTGNRN